MFVEAEELSQTVPYSWIDEENENDIVFHYLLLIENLLIYSQLLLFLPAIYKKAPESTILQSSTEGPLYPTKVQVRKMLLNYQRSVNSDP